MLGLQCIHLGKSGPWFTIFWWRHQMKTFSALLAICAGNSPVPGEFPTQRPVTRSFDAYFDLRPNKRLSKQWWGWWFETQSGPFWRHCNNFDQWRQCDMHIAQWISAILQSQSSGPGIVTVADCLGPFHWYRLTLIPARISNDIHYEVWEWISNF